MKPPVPTYFADTFTHGQVIKWVFDASGIILIGFVGMAHFDEGEIDCRHVFEPFFVSLETGHRCLFFADHATALQEARDQHAEVS